MGMRTRLPGNDEGARWRVLDDEQGFSGLVAAEAFEAKQRRADALAETALPGFSSPAGSSARLVLAIGCISRSLLHHGDASAFGCPTQARRPRLTMNRRALLRPGAVAGDLLRCVAPGTRNPSRP